MTIEPVKREVRFAVVMYGGVSLAIYINGASQELFSMVRATARKNYSSLANPENQEYLIPDEQLKGAEKIYREMGRYCEAAFVIDVISGTSAGGMNGVFLAKALANDQPFNTLKDLWIEEADIDLLVNDRKSVNNLNGLRPPTEPRALLSSQRMYYKLLEVIDKMERQAERPAAADSPLVGELDLYVTATDLRGLPLPLSVNGRKLLENRYRSVFRFHYSTYESAREDSNDFAHSFNPFLAFAARCTSSFPVAFEPMRLADIKEVLAVFKDGQGQPYEYLPELWKKFYKDYILQKPGADKKDLASQLAAFEARPFGDGGYLDNKPFSFATEALLRRRADLPVDRKLIYIDPAPEHPETSTPSAEWPNAIENGLAALVLLPRQETIREDLQFIQERNELIRRVNHMLAQITPEVLKSMGAKVAGWQLKGSEWSQKYLDFSVEYYGPAYAYYNQLRVSSVLSNMASSFARNLNMNEDGAESQTILKELKRSWRTIYYSTSADKLPQHPERKSENDLLYRLDSGFYMRRLQYMQQTINQLLDGLEPLRTHTDPENLIFSLLKTGGFEDKLLLEDNGQEEACRRVLYAAKRELGIAYIDLRENGRRLRQRDLCSATPPTNPDLAQVAAKVRELGKELSGSPFDQRIFGNLAEEISQLISSPERTGYLGHALLDAKEHCARALQHKDIPEQAEDSEKKLLHLQNALLEMLQHFFDRFEYYDMITFPILYGTPVGEADLVEVIRISPEDATQLVDESEGKLKKLQGTRLGNFGAFFAREWRENDMLWGRLDGAECLIKAVMPENDPLRDGFITAATKAILLQDYLPAVKAEFINETQSLAEKELGNKRFEMLTAGDYAGLLELFKTRKINEEFPPARTVSVAARGSQVLGRMFDSMGQGKAPLSLPAKWLLNIGGILSALLSFSLPDSLWNYLFNKWLYLGFFLAVLLGLGGFFLGMGGVSQFGWVSLALLLFIDLSVLTMQGFLKGQGHARRLLRTVIGVLVTALLLSLAAMTYLGLVYLHATPEPGGPLKLLLEALQAANAVK